jgi:hypothetical protein
LLSADTVTHVVAEPNSGQIRTTDTDAGLATDVTKCIKTVEIGNAILNCESLSTDPILTRNRNAVDISRELATFSEGCREGSRNLCSLDLSDIFRGVEVWIELLHLSIHFL